MKLKELSRIPPFLGIGVILIVSCILLFIFKIPRADKPLYLQCLTGFGTFFAVLYALFGDYFKSNFNGIKLIIEVPKENNSATDLLQSGTKIFPAYWHHLVVVNKTPHQSHISQINFTSRS